MGITVGIDLGTTYSAVATFDKATGTTKILKNSLGSDTTPSVVCVENGTITIGAEAKDLQGMGNRNTASFYKSWMGNPNFSMFLDGQSYVSFVPEADSAKTIAVLVDVVSGEIIASRK